MSEYEKNKNEKEAAIDRVRRRLDIKTETMPKEEKHHKAKMMQVDAGEILRPDASWRHAGYAVVHMYQKLGTDREVTFITMAPMDGINEVQAGIALDELKRKLMSAFGRTPRGK